MMTDVKELVDRATSGDREAMNQLISRFQGMAVGYAWSLVGDFHQAEDLAQEAFIQAVRSIGELKNPAAFPLWFKTILRFTCIRRLRRKALQYAGLDEAEGMRAGVIPEDGVASGELREAVRAAVGSLQEEDRSILALYYFEELPHRQIAGFLGIDEYRVNNRLHALRKKLKREWMDMMDYEPAGKDVKFRERVLEGIAKIGYTLPGARPMLTQFCASLAVALPAAGASPELDYVVVAAASGAAFRMIWKKGWHPDNVDIMYAMEDSFEPMRRAFDAAGCRAEFCICEGAAVDWGHNDISGALHRNELQARGDIVTSIDAGMPVLALGVIGPPECCVVTGYERDGDVLVGYNYFQDYVKEDGLSVDEGGRFHKQGWFKGTVAYMRIHECAQVQFGREQCLEALRLAVCMARTPQVGERASGLAAYRTWADQLLHDEDYADIKPGDGDMNFAGKGQTEFATDLTSRFGMFCDPFLMVGERSAAADFCERAAGVLPGCRRELLEAASYYRKMAVDPSTLWKRLGLYADNQEKLRDPDVRSMLAGQVLRMRLLDEQAIMCVERALTVVGG